MNLLLAAVLLVQDKSAEETLKKIEESIAMAKTVVTRGTLATHRFAEELDATKSTITLLLKDDNKLRVELTMRRGDKERRGAIISDGSKLRIRFDSGDTKETPAATRVLWNRMLVRTGLMVGTFMFQDSVGSGKTVDPKEFLPVSDVKNGDDDGTAKTLTFTVTLGGDDTAEVRLWYDPKTLRIQKRTVLAKSKGKPDQGSISETYEDFTLNADIPDEKFNLPQEEMSLEAKISKVKGYLHVFQNALGMYEIDNGKYPTSEQGLSALLTKPKDAKGWKGPYVSEVLLDPWGRAYVYRYPSNANQNTFDLFSCGPDGKEGTADDISLRGPVLPKEKK